MIDNFDVIEKFLEFEEGTFYKFEALVRNTDGENELYYEGSSNINKNILIKSWYVDNQEYYNRIKKEMITLCNMTGARLYITLDRKETKKLLINMFQTISKIVTDSLCGNILSLKSINKLLSSCSSKIEVSEHSRRTIMFDVDSKSQMLVNSLAYYIQSQGQEAHVLKTKKGYHVFCYKKFNSSNWEQDSLDLFYKVNKLQLVLKDLELLTSLLRNDVSMKPNELGLVYMR